MKEETKKLILKGTYSIQINSFDWGCGVTKVIISFDQMIDQVAQNDFIVKETKQVTDFSDPTFPIIISTSEREVTNVYLCDTDGHKIHTASKNIAIEMSVDPQSGSPLLFNMNTQYNTWCDPYTLDISLPQNAKITSQGTIVDDIIIDHQYTSMTTSADIFQTDTYTSQDGITYNYAYYQPENNTDALVVWLHGLGEGGTKTTSPTDVKITLLANKVVSLASQEFQEIIGHAHVLVPQCPTYWMDKDGNQSNFNEGRIVADGHSFYTESLHELIRFYQKQCHASKVVLAGCSNGGFMTLVMAIAYPQDYDAIIPICEALPDKAITDQQIKAIKNIPTYFIYSEDDTVVDPSLHEIPTIKRLKEAEATDLHVFTSEHVVDTSGLYKDEKGNPYQYAGHWSWIYFDNNEANCNDTDIQVWQWIAQQVK